MSKKKPAAETSPFAHLIGNTISALRGLRAEDEQEPDGDEQAEDEDQDPAAEGDTPDTEAEDDADDASAEDDSDDAEAEDEPKDKEARAAYRAGYAAANKRARAIFTASAAAGQVVQAATLAFDTRLSAKEAVSVLQSNAAAGERRSAPLASRMAQRSDPRPGADGGKAGGGTTADKMIAVGKRLGQIA